MVQPALQVFGVWFWIPSNQVGLANPQILAEQVQRVAVQLNESKKCAIHKKKYRKAVR